MFKDILLPLMSHPGSATQETLGKALEAARLLEAHVTGLALETSVPLPVAFRPYGAEVERAIEARQSQMREAAQAALTAFADEARRTGLAHDGQVVTINDGSFDVIVEHARLRGLTITPFSPGDAAGADLIQALIFGSGRPVLVLPQEGEGLRLERIALAWDFSRAAARAVADALPLLRQAKEVRILTVLADKQSPASASGPELVAHLARNGVHATFNELTRGRRPVGEVLEEEAKDTDLMVMGAFGHSRIRDFFLGGATRHVLENPRRPTLLSH